MGAKERLLEHERAKKKRLEEETDSSMLLLERLSQQGPSGREVRRRTVREYADRRRGLSRSRSISVKAVSRSRSRHRNGKRRRRSKSRGDEAFEDSLRRRMAQRESEVDSA